MLNSIGNLFDSPVVTPDGTVGRVLDALFDEGTWRLEYLLIEIGSGTPAIRHLCPVDEVRSGHDDGSLRVDCLRPFSAAAATVGGLRSAREMPSCEVSGWTGALGTTDDAVIDTGSWLMLFLVVEAGGWFPGAVVLVQPYLVENAKWEERTIDIAITHVEVLAAPNPTDADLSSAAEPQRLH